MEDYGRLLRGDAAKTSWRGFAVFIFLNDPCMASDRYFGLLYMLERCFHFAPFDSFHLLADFVMRLSKNEDQLSVMAQSLPEMGIGVRL